MNTPVNRDIKQYAEEAHTDAYLAKLFDMNELLALLDKYVDQGESRYQNSGPLSFPSTY